jgi:hypothetical protein
MIPKIQDNPIFLEDYKNYQKRIGKVTDENIQKTLTDTLVKMKEHVQYIDRCHEQVFITGKMPSEISDLRQEVARFKKTLDEKLHDWEKTQYLKPALHPNEE